MGGCKPRSRGDQTARGKLRCRRRQGWFVGQIRWDFRLRSGIAGRLRARGHLGQRCMGLRICGLGSRIAGGRIRFHRAPRYIRSEVAQRISFAQRRRESMKTCSSTAILLHEAKVRSLRRCPSIWLGEIESGSLSAQVERESLRHSWISLRVRRATLRRMPGVVPHFPRSSTSNEI